VIIGRVTPVGCNGDQELWVELISPLIRPVLASSLTYRNGVKQRYLDGNTVNTKTEGGMSEGWTGRNLIKKNFCQTFVSRIFQTGSLHGYQVRNIEYIHL
jgi:hypothetical protein